MTHFVVVGGFPRAGTTFVRDLLNLDDDVRIRAEIFGETLSKTLDLVSDADGRHAGRWSDARYRRHRTLSILNTLHGFGKRSGPPAVSLRSIEGFKTPLIEARARELIELFGPDELNPLTFVYCVRNIESNFLSAASVWGTPVHDYVRQLKRSAEGLRLLLAQPHVQVVPFSLDHYLAHDNQAGYLRMGVLTPLGVRGISDDALLSYIDAPTGKNSTEKKSLPRRTALTDVEEQALVHDPELAELVEEVETFVGYSIGVAR